MPNRAEPGDDDTALERTLIGHGLSQRRGLVDGNERTMQAAAAIVRRLEASVDVLVRAAVASFAPNPASEGSAANQPPAHRAAAIVGASVRSLLASLESVAGAPDSPIRVTIETSPARWNCLGASPEMIDGCHRAAVNTILRAVAAMAADVADPAIAAATVSIVAQHLATQQAPSVTDRDLDGTRPGTQRLEAALTALLSGGFGSDDEAQDAVHDAGFDVGTPHGVIAFLTTAGSSSARSSAEVLLAAGRDFQRSVAEALVLPPQREPVWHLSIIVSAPPQARGQGVTGIAPPSLASTGWRRAVGLAGDLARHRRLKAVAIEPASGLTRLQRSLSAASRLARIVHADSDGAPDVTAHRDRLLDILLDGIESDAAEAFVEGVLGPIMSLPASRAAPLLETLRALSCNGGSFVAAARRLNVHRETVKYRVGRVRALTGYTVLDPMHRTHLDVALRLVGSPPNAACGARSA